MALLIDADAIEAAVSPQRAICSIREAFIRHAAGEWEMPAKVYVEAPPEGDFRAMPARGGGYAILKWVTSFPRNPERGLPVVAGALLVSDAGTGELLALLDCAAVTASRTAAAAALSAQALAAEGAATVGVIGCGVNGSAAARCLAAAGFGTGACFDPRPEAAERLASELGWSVSDRERAAGCDVVVTVTPGAVPVIGADDLRPGQHIAALGADGHGKSELEPAAIDRCRLFCDEWEQASAGGELAAPFARDQIEPADVTPLGRVLSGQLPGRRGPEEITLFDSTGLAIQDLAIAIAALEAVERGDIEPDEIRI